MENPRSVVKCNCGEVMRLGDWSAHSKTCLKGRARLTSKDIDTLLANEAKKKKQQGLENITDESDLRLETGDYR